MSSFLGGGGGGTGPGSLIATSNLDFYVATTGSDANPGTITQPFATIQHAFNVVGQYDWQFQFTPTIHIANGTYTQNNIKAANMYKKGGFGTVVGNAVTPANVVIQDIPGNGIFSGAGEGCKWKFNGLTLDTPFNSLSPSANAGFRIETGANSGIVITDSTGGHNCTAFNMQNAGIMEVFGTVTFTGNWANQFAFLQYSCLFDLDSAHVNFSSTTAFIDMFFVGNQSTAYWLNVTTTNSSHVTGHPCDIRANSVLTTDHGFITTVPGAAGAYVDPTCAIVSNFDDFATQAINPTDGPIGKVEKFINTVTANYTLAITDAGNIIQGNSVSAISITVPLNATIPFPIGTIIEIAQTNTGNVLCSAASGVTLVSIDSTFDVGAVNGTSFLEKVGTDSWRFSRVLGVPLAGFNRTFFVATTGSDSNPGTAALPFATMTHAALIACTYNYQAIWFPTINVAAGTYTEPAGFVLLPLVINSTGVGVITGNPTTPTNVVSNQRFAATNWNIDGFQVNTDAGDPCFNIFGFGSNCAIDDIVFNNTTGISSSCINIAEYANLTMGITNFTCTALNNFNHLFFCQSYSLVIGAMTFHIGGATWGGNGGAFFRVDEYSFIDATGFAFVGAATGQRYKVTRYSFLDGTGSFNRSQWPGSTVGLLDDTSALPADIIYSVSTPASGGTVTATPGQRNAILNPAGALATLTVNLPTNMSDGETYGTSTSQMITALTMATTDGSSIVGPPTTLAAGSGFEMRFDTSANTWYIST